MDIADIHADVKTLLTEMENRPEDRHELYLQLREKMREFRAFGMPLPDDLVLLEKRLEAEFAQDRAAPSER